MYDLSHILGADLLQTWQVFCSGSTVLNLVQSGHTTLSISITFEANSICAAAGLQGFKVTANAKQTFPLQLINWQKNQLIFFNEVTLRAIINQKCSHKTRKWSLVAFFDSGSEKNESGRSSHHEPQATGCTSFTF